MALGVVRSLSPVQKKKNPVRNRLQQEENSCSVALSPSSSSSSSSSYGGRIVSFHHPFLSISASYADRRVSVSPAGSFKSGQYVRGKARKKGVW